ncbi:ankyrin repeat-containing domain protein [Lasiosphaeria miniovina]|uniref:Ankyrin repeat-containing domain protein n=1 Tax=Lasiosphaeria miniovina TaxID=1954250 RepID=A0AA39ZUP2_9PEZI|nr:ankyrin repeat-containing domain protein [Lasiosphaeria miniovina]KAK0704054.1 ankyrin repeat-containing domain protein [Lasiosphaeria miniovina]
MGDIEWFRFLQSQGAGWGSPHRYTRSHQFQSPLAAAVYHSHIDIVRLLIQDGAVVNEQGFSEMYGSVLAAAAHRANINQVLDTGNFASALAAFASGGSMDILKILIERGGDVNIRGPNRAIYGRGWLDTELAEAAEGGHIHCLQVLLAAGADVNYSPPSDCVRALVEAGAEINQRLEGPKKPDYSGSALADAASSRNLGCLLALIVAGADVNQSPLSELEKCKFGSPFTAAVTSGELECARMLIERGANVNQVFPPQQFGSSALVAAALQGHSLCLQLLLSNGAQPDLPQWPSDAEKFGSALAAAAWNSRLRQQTASVGYYGSALVAAASRGDAGIECISELISSGADVNMSIESGDFGRCLAAAAACSKAFEMTSYLTSAGADVNLQLCTGYFCSALAAATWSGNQWCIRELLDAGADVNQEAITVPEPISESLWEQSMLKGTTASLVQNGFGGGRSEPE